MSEYTNHELYTVYFDKGEFGPRSKALATALEDLGYLIIKDRELRVYNCCDEWFHGLLERCPKCGNRVEDIPKDFDHVRRVADAVSELGKWAVEFKWSEDDFWASMKDKRIYDAMEIGGVVYGNHFSIAICGYESSVVMDHPDQENWIRSIQPKAFHVYGVGFKWCEDEEGMLKYFQAQRKQAYEKTKIFRKKRNIRSKCKQVELIASTPLVGEVLTRDMLLAKGSVKDVINMTHSQLCAFPKVANTKATKIINFWSEDVRDKILDEMVEDEKVD